jgi:hypothetical protein
MPRVTVTVEAVDGEDGRAHILLDEQVQGGYLEDELSSVQFLERLAWAIEDGERLECLAFPLEALTRVRVAHLRHRTLL